MHLHLLVCLGSLMAVLAGSALESRASGAIRGTVQDESGGVVPGATVSLLETEDRPHATTATGRAGTFVFERVPAGDYRVRAELPGFRSVDADVRVADGATATIILTLEVASLADTVTVTRTSQALGSVPSAVSVITGEEIQSGERRVNAGDAFRGVPGLLAMNRQNYSASGGVRLAIRAPLPGSGMRGVQLVQDGIPITTADGTNQPTNLALGSVGRVEIIRGPSSVLYGNSAGGVISLFTEYPPSDRVQIQPDVQFGSDGYTRQQVKAEGTLGRFGYVVDGSRMTTDGYRTHSAAEVRQANIALRYARSSRTELRGVFNLFDMPFGESASTLTLADARTAPRSVRPQAITQGWGEASQQGQGGLTVDHQFKSGRQLRVTGWGMWRSTWNPIPSRIIDLGRTGGGVRSEYRGSTTVGALPLDWTTGFDLSYQHDNRNEFVNGGVPAGGTRAGEGALLQDQLEEVLSAAPFVEVGVALRPTLRFTAGARYDLYRFEAHDRFLRDGDQSGSRHLRAMSPKIGLTWSASESLNVYTGFSTAYLTPTTVELSNRPTGEGGFNEDLQPATLRSYEAGVRGLVPALRLRYELTGYVSALDDAFVSFQRADEQTFFVNAARARRDGIEARLAWSPSPRLDASLAYTFQDFRFDRFVTAGVSYAGRREPGSVPHQIAASTTYHAPFGVRATTRLRWLDAYPVNNANTVSDWSSRVVDLRIGVDRTWRWLSWRPFVGIDNLFDERYNASTSPNAAAGRYFEPAPGREIYVGLTLGAGT